MYHLLIKILGNSLKFKLPVVSMRLANMNINETCYFFIGRHFAKLPQKWMRRLF